MSPPVPAADAPRRLRFGLFLPPYHAPRENPTLALERDLELIVHLDRLGFDEAWVGEHHSTGWETIGSPEIFLAIAAERTRHIRLGTGAVSLPYHHPLMVADRIVLLDHLTRGRVDFGVGPGGHLSDAAMLGLDPGRLRELMAERLDVIMRLLREREPFSAAGEGWSLTDAVLQLRPFQDPHPPVAVTSMESPAGMQLAGRHGAGVLQLAVARGPRGPIDLATHWSIAEEAAAEHGTAVDRGQWRLVSVVHLADTRERALAEIAEGAGEEMLDYTEAVTGRPSPVPGPRSKIAQQLVESGAWIVGTPDDAVAGIRELQERSGGFGCLLVRANEWAPTAAVHRSYELLARHVIPHFQGSLDGLEASRDVAAARSAEIGAQRAAAVEKAQRSWEDRGR